MEEGKESRKEGGEEGRRKGREGEKRGEMSYLGWVSIPCNLSSLTRTTSWQKLNIVAIIKVIVITINIYKENLSIGVGFDQLIFNAPSSPGAPGSHSEIPQV